jgi:hypothetical protein
MKAGKPFPLPGIVIFMILLMAFFSCKKSGIIDITPGDPFDSAKTPSNSPMVAIAGPDQIAQLPLDYVFLNGSYGGTQNNFDRVQWQKLSGPSCLIENQNGLLTKVSGLKEGTYQFELTVFDKSNLPAKDWVTVTVNPVPVNVIINQHFVVFNSLEWIFPWYASIEAKNIHSYLPQNAPIQVFVQRSSSNNWIQVQPASNNSNNNTYEYFIETRPDGGGIYNYGSLYVFYYGFDTDDNPKIKVEF